VLVFPLPQSHSDYTDILSCSSRLWNEDEDYVASLQNEGLGSGTLTSMALWPAKKILIT
jgi:hypothetical protein